MLAKQHSSREIWGRAAFKLCIFPNMRKRSLEKLNTKHRQHSSQLCQRNKGIQRKDFHLFSFQGQLCSASGQGQFMWIKGRAFFHALGTKYELARNFTTAAWGLFKEQWNPGGVGTWDFSFLTTRAQHSRSKAPSILIWWMQLLLFLLGGPARSKAEPLLQTSGYKTTHTQRQGQRESSVFPSTHTHTNALPHTHPQPHPVPQLQPHRIQGHKRETQPPHSPVSHGAFRHCHGI